MTAHPFDYFILSDHVDSKYFGEFSTFLSVHIAWSSKSSQTKICHRLLLVVSRKTTSYISSFLIKHSLIPHMPHKSFLPIVSRRSRRSRLLRVVVNSVHSCIGYTSTQTSHKYLHSGNRRICHIDC